MSSFGERARGFCLNSPFFSSIQQSYGKRFIIERNKLHIFVQTKPNSPLLLALTWIFLLCCQHTVKYSVLFNGFFIIFITSWPNTSWHCSLSIFTLEKNNTRRQEPVNYVTFHHKMSRVIQRVSDWLNPLNFVELREASGMTGENLFWHFLCGSEHLK